MRIGTFLVDEMNVLGVVSEDGVQYLNSSDGWPNNMIDWILESDKFSRRYKKEFSNLSFNEIDNASVIAPIPRPIGNVMCLGKNYAGHAKETASGNSAEVEKPEYPLVFTKGTNTINGPFGNIPYNANVSRQIDWEVEMAVIVGKKIIDVHIDDALDAVFGYTVLNDISARDVQYRHKQFYLGKSMDGFCPMGPWIVTSDEIGNPQNLDVRCWVNGELMQDSNTAEQMFTVAETIAMFSKGHTLYPGDIIATGTPEGVGFVRTPPIFLQPGDVLESEVGKIGKMRNVVI